MGEYKEYLKSLSRRVETIASSEKKSSVSTEASLRELADSIPAKVSIPGEKGRCDDYDLSCIKDDIGKAAFLNGKGRHAELASIRRRLELMSDMIQNPKPGINPEKARSALNAVLSDGQYGPSLWDVILYKVFSFIGRVLSKLDPHLSGGTINTGTWVILTCALALILFCLIRFIIQPRSSAMRRRRRLDTANTEVESTRPNIDALLAMADEQAAHRQYREALRALYRAALLRMDDLQIINYSDSGTNWEYVRKVSRTRPDFAESFRTVTTLFDESVYGRRELAESDFRSSKSAYLALEEN